MVTGDPLRRSCSQVAPVGTYADATLHNQISEKFTAQGSEAFFGEALE